MSGRKSRTKGAAWEREVARRFREAMPGCDAKRGWQQRSGAEMADVELPFFWPECKVGKKPPIRAAMQQAYSDAEGSGRMPIVIIKEDRKRPFVVVDFDDFLNLVSQWWPALDR